MTDGIDNVWSHAFLWIVTVTVIAFNIAAAMAHNAKLTYMALALTGIAALVAIGLGIWNGLRRFNSAA
ncbi:MAG: hypothetical protein WC816_09455 [Sphingomonas sp.]|jgi:hypothetical protein